MAYSANSIANFFIKKAISENDTNLNLMKLLKLIYIAHGWSLAIFNQELIKEPIEAWVYGPVVYNVYHKLKHYGNYPIDEAITDYRIGEDGLMEKVFYEEKFDSKLEEFLERIWSVYKVNTGIQLSNWTHLEGSPWHKAWHSEGGHKLRRYKISNDSIKEYFVKLGKENGRSHD